MKIHRFCISMLGGATVVAAIVAIALGRRTVSQPSDMADTEKTEDISSGTTQTAEAADWGPVYVPGMEHGPRSLRHSRAIGRAERYIRAQPFAGQYAKRACDVADHEDHCDVSFALLSDPTGKTRGLVRVPQLGECSWHGTSDALALTDDSTGVPVVHGSHGTLRTKELVLFVLSARIAESLPKAWHMGPIESVESVSGWNRLSGSSGVRITFSRAPYDNTLHRMKSGELSVYVPRFFLDVFPDDFVGRNRNDSGEFRDGKVTKRRPGPSRSMLVLDGFARVGNWFVFHNDRTFEDWKTPADDVINLIREALARDTEALHLGRLMAEIHADLKELSMKHAWLAGYGDKNLSEGHDIFFMPQIKEEKTVPKQPDQLYVRHGPINAEWGFKSSDDLEGEAACHFPSLRSRLHAKLLIRGSANAALKEQVLRGIVRQCRALQERLSEQRLSPPPKGSEPAPSPD